MSNDKFYLSREDYDKGISLMIRFCLDFAVVKDGQVLLSKRLIEPFNGLWALPGGMVRKGESIQQAAERILTNELGQKASSLELVGNIEYLNEHIAEKGITTHSVSMVFKTQLETGDLHGSFQAEEMQFFSTIPDDTIPQVKEFLEKNWPKLIG